jgi:glutamate N-acetyltransferase/amino-acid N-acetyltransferase
MSIHIGGFLIVENGVLNPAYDESLVTAHMKKDHILIEVNAGTKGSGKATVWTCDLTEEYIRINADYRS